MARCLNHRLAKSHRSYSIEEVGRTWGVHRNTVRQWIKHGLKTIDRQKPLLIQGRDLAEFLLARRRRQRRPCAAGEIYCVRCRLPRMPAGKFVDYTPLTTTQGNLVGICPDCACRIYRRVSLAKLDAAKGGLDVRRAGAERHIGEIASPSVNSDFKADEPC